MSIEQTGEHFERRRFARAVGAEEAHYFARRHVKRNAVHGFDIPRFADDQTFQRGFQPALPVGDGIGFAEVGEVEDGGDRRQRRLRN